MGVGRGSVELVGDSLEVATVVGDGDGAANRNGSLTSRLTIVGVGSSGADHLYEPSSNVIEVELDVLAAATITRLVTELLIELISELVIVVATELDTALASAEKGASCPAPRVSMLQLAAFSRYRTSLEAIKSWPLIQILKPPSF